MERKQRPLLHYTVTREATRWLAPAGGEAEGVDLRERRHEVEQQVLVLVAAKRLGQRRVLEVDARERREGPQRLELLRADRAVEAEKGICLKVSQKTAIGITVGGIIVSFLIGLAIGFGCVASSHGVTSTPRPGLASGVRVARELCGR